MTDKNKLGKVLPSLIGELGRDGSLQERLKILVDSVGNPNAFAKLTGLSVSGLKRYLGGGEPSVLKLLQICDATGVNPNWLMRGRGLVMEPDEVNGISNERAIAMMLNDEAALAELDDECLEATAKPRQQYLKAKASFDFLSPEIREVLSTAFYFASKEFDEDIVDQALTEITSNRLIEKDFALIPGYSVQVSAGNGSVGSDAQVPSRYLAFRKGWLQYKGFKQQDLIALWAKGDSMDPLIGDNDTLIIHTTEKRPTDGNIYVLRLEDQLWVKRIQVTPLGSYLLISDNSIYPPMEIKKEEMGNFDVIGRVVHIAKDV